MSWKRLAKAFDCIFNNLILLTQRASSSFIAFSLLSCLARCSWVTRSCYPLLRSALILQLGSGSFSAFGYREAELRAADFRRGTVGSVGLVGLMGLWVGQADSVEAQPSDCFERGFAGMLTLAAAAIELAKLSGLVLHTHSHPPTNAENRVRFFANKYNSRTARKDQLSKSIRAN